MIDILRFCKPVFYQYCIYYEGTIIFFDNFLSDYEFKTI